VAVEDLIEAGDQLAEDDSGKPGEESDKDCQEVMGDLRIAEGSANVLHRHGPGVQKTILR
jgi:hypothetical protein